MSTKSDASSAATDADFVLTRVFNAPRELVFQAWTKPEHMVPGGGRTSSPIRFASSTFGPAALAHRNARPQRRYAPGQGNLSGNRAPERLAFTIDHSDLSDQWHDMVNPNRDKNSGQAALERG